MRGWRSSLVPALELAPPTLMVRTNFFLRCVENPSISAAFLPLTLSNPYAIPAILRNLRELRKLLEFALICA